MARPTTPLIDPEAAIATALDLIDREGLEQFSLRRLAAALGVNATSLYHHFRDKQAILDGVRVRIALQSDLAATPPANDTWQERLRQATFAYHDLLLRHPNVAPLMRPDAFERPFGLILRERVVAKLLDDGVPPHLVHAITDSVELLAYASAVLNPTQQPPSERLPIVPEDGAPALAESVRAAPTTAQEMFEMQVDAIIAGWSERVGRTGIDSGVIDPATERSGGQE